MEIFLLAILDIGMIVSTICWVILTKQYLKDMTSEREKTIEKLKALSKVVNAQLEEKEEK